LLKVEVSSPGLVEGWCGSIDAAALLRVSRVCLVCLVLGRPTREGVSTGYNSLASYLYSVALLHSDLPSRSEGKVISTPSMRLTLSLLSSTRTLLPENSGDELILEYVAIVNSLELCLSAIRVL
jgi:hypothetical protein